MLFRNFPGYALYVVANTEFLVLKRLIASCGPRQFCMCLSANRREVAEQSSPKMPESRCIVKPDCYMETAKIQKIIQNWQNSTFCGVLEWV